MKKIMYDAQKFCVFTHFFVTLFTNFSSFIMFMRDKNTINMMKHEKNMKKHENLWKTWKMREVVKNVWTMWKIMMYMIFHFFIVHQILQLSQNFVKNEFFENFGFLQFFAFSKFLQVSSSTSSMMTSKVVSWWKSKSKRQRELSRVWLEWDSHPLSPVTPPATKSSLVVLKRWL